MSEREDPGRSNDDGDGRLSEPRADPQRRSQEERSFAQGGLPLLPSWLASFLHIPASPAVGPGAGSLVPPTQDPAFWPFVIDSVREYAIFTTDLDGVITTWNSGAQRILGYTEPEIVGRKCDTI